MAFLKSDADAIRTAIAEAVRDTLARIDPANGTRLRESEQDREVRLKEEKRSQKYSRRASIGLFEASGMDRKTAKKAARSLEFGAYRARLRG